MGTNRVHGKADHIVVFRIVFTVAKYSAEIYLKIADQVLKDNQQAIILVPEIFLTPQTINRFKKYFGDDALALFVQAPSIEILEKRLRGRKTESEERIQMRIDKAQKEMESALEFDEIIVNDDLEKALGKAIELISKFIETPCE
jgi:guanylate kinase